MRLLADGESFGRAAFDRAYYDNQPPDDEIDVMVDGDEALAVIEDAKIGKTSWGKAATMLRRISWYLDTETLAAVVKDLVAFSRTKKAGDKDYHLVLSLLEHLSFVADKVWEGA